MIIVHFLSLRFTKRKAIRFANFNVIEKITGKRIISKNWILLFMRVLIVVSLILSASGTTYWYTGLGSDFDYGILIDASVSMLADDFQPSRIAAAKESALGFVDAVGSGAGIGVITFTGTTYLKQRLTDNHADVARVIDSINIETAGGTAVGDALVTGSNLFFSEADKSNVLILLTDGQSNVGLTAQEAIPFLLDNQILVYTIGIGTVEGGNILNQDITSRLDEETLRLIASETGGQYFSASSNDDLSNAFKQIARLKTKRLSKDLTSIFLISSIVLLLVEWSLLNTKYRSLP